MTEFNCIGRVGALAVALGVGAVIAPAATNVPSAAGPSVQLVAATAAPAAAVVAPTPSVPHPAHVYAPIPTSDTPTPFAAPVLVFSAGHDVTNVPKIDLERTALASNTGRVADRRTERGNALPALLRTRAADRTERGGRAPASLTAPATVSG